MFPLAQSRDLDAVTGVFKWIAVLLVVVVVLIVIALWLRRRFSDASEDEMMLSSTAFTLSDLRRMHAEGKMSDEEFEAAKRGGRRPCPPPPHLAPAPGSPPGLRPGNSAERCGASGGVAR